MAYFSMTGSGRAADPLTMRSTASHARENVCCCSGDLCPCSAMRREYMVGTAINFVGMAELLEQSLSKTAAALKRGTISHVAPEARLQSRTLMTPWTWCKGRKLST